MASINKEVLKIEIKIFHVTISMKCWCQISVRFTMDRLWFSCCPLSEDGPLFYPIKGIVSRLCARTSVLFFFSSKDNRTVIFTRQDFLPGPHRRRRFVVYILK